MSVVEVYFRSFDALLAERHPQLLQHFEEIGLVTDVFLVDWMYTLFTRYENNSITGLLHVRLLLLLLLLQQTRPKPLCCFGCRCCCILDRTALAAAASDAGYTYTLFVLLQVSPL